VAIKSSAVLALEDLEIDATENPARGLVTAVRTLIETCHVYCLTLLFMKDSMILSP
jgi:hypothetical protein